MNNKKLAAILGCCTVFVAVVVAIASLSPRAVADYSTLLRYLSDSGASIREEGKISWSFFCDIESKRIIVDGAPITVYEYDNAEAMEAEASCVSPDGNGITKENCVAIVDWIAPPHFYRAGRIIVIYIGENRSTISLLKDALGAQFAGR